MKRFLALLFSVATTAAFGINATAVNYSQAAPAGAEDIVWQFNVITLDGDTCAEIFGIYDDNAGNNAPYYGDIVIPQTVYDGTNGYVVRKIAKLVFPPYGNGVTSITIPDYVKEVEDHFAVNCHDLMSFAVNESSSYFSVYGGALYNKDLKKLIAVPARSETISIAQSATEIGSHAFDGCFRLSSVTLPATVNKIDANAFANVPRLTAIYYAGSTPSDIDASAYTGVHTSIYIGPIPSDAQTTVQSENFRNVKWFYSVVNGNAVLCNEGNQPCIDTATTVTSDLLEDDSLIIPSSLGGYPVTKIGDNAFTGCAALTKVTIPQTIAEIGDFAFSGCSGILELELPESVKTLGKHPFAGASLKNIALPESIRSFSNGNPLAGCDETLSVSIPGDNSYFMVDGGVLYDKDGYTVIGCPARTESVSLRPSVRTIGPEAFSGCFRLKAIQMPQSLTTVKTNAFLDCVRLESLNFPSNVDEIATRAFDGCNSLSFIGFSGNAPTTVDPDVFGSAPAGLKIYVEQDSTGWDGTPGSSTLPATWPAGSANGRAIQRFAPPQSEELHEGDIFPLTTTNTDVRITWTLKVLANKGLEILEVNPKPTEDFEAPAYFDFSQGRYTVQKLGDRLFANSIGLTSVTLSATTLELGNGVFDGCTSLASVTLNYGLRKIGLNAFNGNAIEEIAIPDTVEVITGNPLYGCRPSTKLTISENNPFFAVSSEGALYDRDFETLISVPMTAEALVVPATTTAFASDAFYKSIRMKKIVFDGPEPTATDAAFTDCHASLTNYIRTAVGWAGITLPTTWHGRPLVKYTDAEAGEGNDITDWNRHLPYEDDYGIWEYILHRPGVVEITGAPKNITGNVVVPETIKDYPVTVIGCSSFDEQNLVNSLKLPSTVTNIDSSAFWGCSALQSIEIPSEVTYIGQSAFSGCTLLSQITLPTKLTDLGSSAFSGCKHLTAVTIPNGITAIPSSAFNGCISLTNVTFSGTLMGIDSSAFAGCSALKSIELPEGFTSVGANAFANCKALGKVEFPFSISSLGNSSFYGCTNLTSYAQIVFQNDNRPAGLEESYLYKYIVGGGSGTGGEADGNGVYTTADGWHYRLNGDFAEIWNNDGTAVDGATSTMTLSVPQYVDGHLVTKIGNGAFKDLSALSSITIPEGVVELGTAPFSGTKITQLNLPASLESVDGDPGRGCNRLVAYIIDRGNQDFSVIDDCLFNYDGTVLISKPAKHVDPQDTTTTDDSGNDWQYSVDNGKARLTDLESSKSAEVEVPSQLGIYPVTALDSSVFKGNDAVTKITLPATVTSIPEDAFDGCTALEEIVVAPGNPAFKSMYGALYSADGKTLIKVPAKMDLPITTTTVNESSTVTQIRYFSEAGEQVVTQSKSGTVTSSNSETSKARYSFDDLLKGVTTVGAHAYSDLGMTNRTDPEITLSAVTNSIAGFYNGHPAVTETITYSTVTVSKGIVTPSAQSRTAASISAPLSAISVADGSSAVNKSTVKAVVVDRNGAVVGAVEFKLGKPKSDGRSKVTASVYTLQGKKKSAKASNGFITLGAAQQTVKFSVKELGEMTATFSSDGKGISVSGDLGGDALFTATVGGEGYGSAEFLFQNGFDSVLNGAVVINALLPHGEPIAMNGRKWSLAKAASVKYTQNGLVVNKGDPSSPKTNLSGLKLSYNAKTGVFKGSFKAYTLNGDKLKSTKIAVTGLLVNGIGYGTAGACPVIIK